MDNVKKITLRENVEGNIYKLHPETDTEQVLTKDGKNVETILTELSDKAIAGTYTTTITVPSKQPKTVTVPLQQTLKDTNYIVLAQARGTRRLSRLGLRYNCILIKYK